MKEGSFKIILNEKQKEELAKAGFEGLTEDTDNILFYIHKIIGNLESHNKNYTKSQYYEILTLAEIFDALIAGY